MSSEPFAALVSSNVMDFWHNAEPLCPHCKHSCDINRNELWHLYNDDEPHKIECPVCEQQFAVRSHASWTFSTDEQDDA